MLAPPTADLGLPSVRGVRASDSGALTTDQFDRDVIVVSDDRQSDVPRPAELTRREVAALAIGAHAGQREMYGAPYREHLRVVANGLAQFGPEMEMAGWLHDSLEETTLTAEELRSVGVPERVVELVQRVTRAAGESYLDSIRRIARDPEATLIKIADNADSIHPERVSDRPDADELRADFEQALRILWPAASRENITRIVDVVNPPLLTTHEPILAGIR